TQMRSRYSLAVVTLDMAVVGVVAIIFLVQHSASVSTGSGQTGSQLFEALAIFQLCLVLFITPASMAAAVSGERQRGTWDLLRVTRLSAFDIIWAKLLAGLTINMLLLAAALPLFGSVFLFGGVTATDVVRTYVVLVASILLLAAISLFVSVLSARPVVCVIVSNVISMLISFGLSLLIVYGETGQQATQLPDLSELASLPPEAPALTPLAQVDPLVALVSALPRGQGGTLLGRLGIIHQAFRLPLRLDVWEAFCILSIAIAIVLLGLSTAALRWRTTWLRRGVG
ncbi:MAG TPA: ABC transporter permease, partial [Chloroflexota bacterium]